jgi:integrase
MKRPKPIHYRGGIITPTAAGTFRACVNAAYRKFRKTLKTQAKAEGWIDDTVLSAAAGIRPLDFTETQDARRALAMLPAGATLAEAAREYAARHAGPVVSVMMPAAVKQFLAEKREAGLREKSLYTLKSRLTRLAEAFADKTPSEIRPPDLLAWLDRGGYQGETRDNFRRDWVGFWAWARRMGYATDNPAEAITRPARDEILPGILTLAEVRRLFARAEKKPTGGETDFRRLVPFLAVGFFAGVRPAELLRLTWGDVRAVPGEIRIGPAASKTRQQRFVKILPNLEAWLAVFGPRPGRLAPLKEAWLGKSLRALRRAAKIKSWPADCARRCFASYHYAAYEDAPTTAAMMGHAGLDVFFRHYRGLARKSDGLAYFATVPGMKTRSYSANSRPTLSQVVA